MSEIIVVGIGNPARGDDAAGWAVIDKLEKRIPEEIELSKQRGDFSALMEIFASHDSVYLVDACLSDAPPGSWKRLDGLQEALKVEKKETSTHALSIPEAIALSRELDQLPKTLIIYAIAGSSFQITSGLSPAVAGKIESIARSILNEKEIQACMKKV
ncbi:MAG TPA: hydrogenase maturation protease [Parachlamydiales bacterium]|nr:MAG: hypothetical protein A3D18_04440 [Chlamydiae bacterium RIFCSPHIGHO2_02_FULL_49_29]OGN64322.1 MAG: hypothetical protein A3E26_00415 [Chlamydiae bacterium RIFCSPHIGHO2_12_FULL_49_32]HAZ16235.1 hydrogenase maturation protease [Parachlamydiales bacterium]